MERKVVLVTGSSRGIGKSCILEFAKSGYDVVINYNHSLDDAYSLKELVEKLITERLKELTLIPNISVRDNSSVSEVRTQIKEEITVK